MLAVTGCGCESLLCSGSGFFIFHSGLGTACPFCSWFCQQQALCQGIVARHCFLDLFYEDSCGFADPPPTPGSDF